MDNHNINKGIFFGISSYVIWGILPIYWKLLEETRADIVLAHRIIWSFIFMIIFIFFTKRSRLFIKECKQLLRHKKKLLIITIASITVSANWLIFIWAVQNELVVQASLGYYINPLMSVLLGVFILKERLSKIQIVSFLLAGIGVTYLTISYGIFPWVSIFLASSFAFYGLLKKVAKIDATFSLTIETLLLTPFTLVYLFNTFGFHIGLHQASFSTDILLILSGVVTAVPLLFFGIAVLHIPLSLTGFLQYIAPTLMLIIGVFLYNETFTKTHLITFTFIWTSLILYMASSLAMNKKKRKYVA